MSPETVTALGMGAVALIGRAPELLRIWAADRKDKRARDAAKDGAK